METFSIRNKIKKEYSGYGEASKELRNRILQLVGDLPRIELFARQKTEGWDVWGNEIESDIKLPTISTKG